MTAKASLTKPPDAEVATSSHDGMGLYLHVPFCLHKCPYCSFYSVAAGLELTNRYVEAIKQQITQFAACKETQSRPLTTIFFGGGTPSILPAEILRELLQECLHHFPSATEMEISIEVNPATIDMQGLEILQRAGFNRLSIGIQSLNDRELKILGRPHSSADAIHTVRLAREAGFANISIDLMYGLPDQDIMSWQDTLRKALTLAPEHLSLYELTIEKNTNFFRQLTKGNLQLPPEDDVLAMMEVTQQLITAAGLIRYEISNYAPPDFQCRHNINYWHNGAYIGLGPGAVASLDGTRYTSVADVEQFCDLLKNGQEPWQEKETLEIETRFRETVIMGLRMTQGVSLDALRMRFDIDAAAYYGTTLTRLISQELLKLDDERLRLTEQGLLLANTVMAELV